MAGGLTVRLPILDFNAPDAPQAFCRSLHETGFAVLRNHPLPQSLVERIYADWRAFFDTPAKHAYAFDAATGDGFFSTAASETAKGQTQRDLKEFFHIFPWGRYPAEVSGAAQDYYALASALAGTLMSWVQTHSPAEVLSRFSMPLPQMLEGSEHTLLRVLHYPPLGGEEPLRAVRAAAHTDINLLTLLPAATEPGLQIRTQTGEWLDVPCDFGSLIVNIGDMLQEASGHYYPSTLHRVINPTGSDRAKSRVSLPLFLHPRREVVLSQRYTVGSYFDERMQELRSLDR
ncbi:MAG: 2OG-Fe(II) oxygenase family protein [Rhodoferax sp.]|nr:2OG-Fe(II) oxygenase family protein [Rhodoferax sp.]